MHLFSAQMTDYFIPWTHRVMTMTRWPILGPRIPTHTKATVGWNYPTAAAASCLLPIPQPTKKAITRQKQHTPGSPRSWLERQGCELHHFLLVKPGGFSSWFLLGAPTKHLTCHLESGCVSVHYAFWICFWGWINSQTNNATSGHGAFLEWTWNWRDSKSFKDVLLRERFLETKFL